MKSNKLHIIAGLLLLHLLPVICTAQNTVLHFTDSIYQYNMVNISVSYTPPVFRSREDLIDRQAEKEDSDYLRQYKQLQYQKPDTGNYAVYAGLGNVLWALHHNGQAKKILLTIIESEQPFYTSSHYHNSDIPGDTTINSYGYGSYISSYKNSAAQKMALIYIEEKNFKKALHYLSLAENVYKVQYNCGTGAHWHQQQMTSLYAVCYEGLGDWNRLIDLYLREDFFHDEYFVKVVKRKYSAAEIKRQIRLALDNIMLVRDNWASETFTEEESGKMKLISRNYNATGSTWLFGKKITLSRPQLKDGETVTRQHFINEFKTSVFYTELIAKKEPR